MSFIKHFVLSSGSLKELANRYGITYPTLRLRLDRLIEKIKVLDQTPEASPFERTLRAHYAEGKLDDSSFKTLLSAYHKQERVQP